MNTMNLSASEFVTGINKASEWSKYPKMVYLVPDYLNIDYSEKWTDIKPDELAYYQERYRVDEINDNDVTGKYGPAALRTLRIKIVFKAHRNHKFSKRKDALAFARKNLDLLRKGQYAYENIFS